MLGIIVNEKELCEKALNNNELPKRPMKIIRLIIKKYFNEGRTKDEIYELINKFMIKSYEGYKKIDWKKILIKTIDGIKEYNNFKLVDVNEIVITKAEWNKILELNNNQLERLAFVLLCYQKANEIINPMSKGWINVDLSNIFKEAKIQKSIESKKMLFELKEKKYISLKNSCDSTSIKIDYNIKDNDFIVVDSLKDYDVITYYNELINDKKYKSCECCGKRFEINNIKNTSQIYCNKCKKDKEKEKYNKYNKKRKYTTEQSIPQT